MGRPLTDAGRLRRLKSLELDDATDLRREINDVLLAYGLSVDETMQQAIDEVSKQAVLELRAASSENGWKNYARGWVYESKADKKGIRRNVLYNKKYGQLTHLLENGHVIKNKKGTYGHTHGIKHIKPVEEWASDELPRRILEDIP